MNVLAIHFPCWLIPLIVGLLAALFGFLLGRLFSNNNSNDEITGKITKLETDLASCNKAKKELQAELEVCKKNKLDLETSAASLKTNIHASLSNESSFEIPFDADAAKAAFGKKIKQNDLKIVEGIGPKIESLFHNFNIKTWKALSETSIEKCQDVLDSGGERFRMHKPGTWPKQAKLAYEGKWQELVKWQDELDGGKA
ncbi:hypothetical protein ACQY1Q_07990 [Tenacibaculum sp. TC6]|uniref:hypothetical protein n=1 Tax=Tenacibaculum sp. TC6 TaxID=3423223 RepID=UPI003D35F57F